MNVSRARHGDRERELGRRRCSRSTGEATTFRFLEHDVGAGARRQRSKGKRRQGREPRSGLRRRVRREVAMKRADRSLRLLLGALLVAAGEKGASDRALRGGLRAEARRDDQKQEQKAATSVAQRKPRRRRRDAKTQHGAARLGQQRGLRLRRDEQARSVPLLRARPGQRRTSTSAVRSSSSTCRSSGRGRGVGPRSAAGARHRPVRSRLRGAGRHPDRKERRSSDSHRRQPMLVRRTYVDYLGEATTKEIEMRIRSKAQGG